MCFYANYRKLTANYSKIIVVYVWIKEFAIKFTDIIFREILANKGNLI
jgi:hypothetical protein